jgi:putative ABC transport system permease protein
MADLAHALHVGLRSLARSRGYFAASVLVLALAIGSTTAVFGLVDAILLKPLPFHDPARLVVVWEKNVRRNVPRNVAAPSNYLAWKEASRSFGALEALAGGGKGTLGGATPEPIRSLYVTAGLLPALGVAPVLGRQLAPEENLSGRGHVVLISHGLWQRRFGGDPGVLEKTIELDGETHRIAGVLPAGFQLLVPAEVVLPLGLDPSNRTWQGRWLVVLGRLAPGVSLAAAQDEMGAIAGRLAAADPAHDTDWTVNLVPLGEQLLGEVRPALLVLAGAVSLVLLIACTNVANLALARTAARGHEIGVRLALGASASRLFGQLAIEALLVAGAGGAAGLLLARLALGLAREVAPLLAPSVPIAASLAPSVLVFAAIVTLVAGLVVSLVAALAARGRDVVALLKRGTAAPAQARMRSVLVVAETAFSVVLLVGAGLLTRSVLALLTVETGFSSDRAAAVSLSIPSARYETPEKQAGFARAALERASALPGVEAAGTISTLPLDGLGSATTFTIEGAPAPAPGQKPSADVRAVSGDAFGALGIRLFSGRALPASPAAAGAPVPLLVNREMVRQLFPKRSPLGARLTVDMWNGIHGEIVGVVGDVRLVGLEKEPRATIYWDARNRPTGDLSLVVRGERPSALGAALAREIRALDPGLAVTVRPLGSLVGVALGTQRSLALLVGAFAAAALLLTAVGLYGVVSYLVTQRTLEIGVRMALGAAPRDVVGGVLRGGGTLVGAGAAAGLSAAALLAPLLARVLHGVAPRDPLTFVAVPVLLLAAALAACALPALRAARIDPIVALRTE